MRERGSFRIGVGLLCAAAAATAAFVLIGQVPQSQTTTAPAAMLPAGVDTTRLTTPPGHERIDLTEPGAVAWSVAEAEIIDTRLFDPQVYDGSRWDGQTRFLRDVLPPHKRRPLTAGGQPNDLVPGALADAERVEPGAALFPGLDVGQGGGWQPPDCTLAVGPEHIVCTVNMAIGFYGKDGSEQFVVPLNDTGSPGFFEPVGAGGFTFDPKCFYDHYSERFVVIAPEVYDNSAWMCIAVSDDSNPHGIWYKYRTDCVIWVGWDSFWLDYPGLGFDQDAIYVTGNLFGLNNSGWAGVLFRIFDKAPMLNGDPVSYADLRDGGAASVQVAQHFGNNPAPYFVSVNGNTSLRIHAILDPLGSPSLTSTTVAVPYFDYRSSDPPNVGGTLWTFDSRIMNVHWRDGDLYAAHHIDVGGRNVARWYHLNTNDWPNSGSVSYVESGNIDEGGGVHTYFPAIYANQFGSVALVMASSTSSTTPVIKATGRVASDPLGTMAATTTLKVSDTGADGRWGDYFDVAVDPTNDATFWLMGEYQTSSGWRTWIQSFSVVTCNGDLNADGTVDLADLSILLSNYGSTGAQYDDGDLDGNGTVDLSDLSIMLAVYDTNC